MTESSRFPTLDEAALRILDGIGTRQRIAVGDYLYRQGDPTYDFYVVVSGAIEAELGEGGEEQVIGHLGAGQFLGEMSLITGQRVFVSARVVEDGEVIRIPRDALRQLIATNPKVGDTILAAFLSRRKELLAGAGRVIRVIGSRFSVDTLHIREFLIRNRIPHEWTDSDADGAVDALLLEFGVTAAELPVVIVSGNVLRRATPGALADYLGLSVGSLPGRCFDLLVVGGGPAGLAAAVYGASEGLRTLVVEMVAVGGQAGGSSRIENYLGFPMGISGGDLTARALVQAEKFGANLTSPCTAVALREESGHLVVRLSGGEEVAGRAVIVASGARYRRLDVDRLADFEGNGVYYAATEMEARRCVPQPVLVVGGGNSAGQAAMFLAGTGCPVTLVVRGPSLAAGMSRYLVERISADPRITVRTGTQVTALEGDERELRAAHVSSDDGDAVLPCAALFSFIGAEPSSDWLSGCAALDSHGFVLTGRSLTADGLDERWTLLGRPPLPYETSHPGLFAAGDVRAGSTKRVAAAVGEGSAAVRSVHEYLSFVS